MTRYLLDTVTLSELRRPGQNAPVHAWLDRHNGDDLYVSVMTLGEVAKGIERLDSSRPRNDLEAWLAGIRAQYESFILPVDDEVATTWGRIVAPMRAAGRPEPTVDALTAATAIVHDLTIVTRNTRDFEYFGVATTNPWENQP